MVQEIEEWMDYNLETFIGKVDDILGDPHQNVFVGDLNERPWILSGDNPENEEQIAVPIHDFSLDLLRKFPRYLSDSILKTDATVICMDHRIYWAWTAACATEAFSPNPEAENQETQDLSFLHDFYNIVHLSLFIPRNRLLDDRVRKFIESMNHSIGALKPDTGVRLAVLNGFPALEGLISRHCEHLSPKGEQLEKTIPDSPWRPAEKPMGDTPNYHDKLQIWAHFNASDAVQSTLEEVNDLTRYDMDILMGKFEGASNVLEEEKVDGTNNFLRVLKSERNQNLHGIDDTRMIGAMVLDLCCLVIWDMISDNEFERIQTHVMEQLERRQQMDSIQSVMHSVSIPASFQPESFYPLSSF